MKTNSKTVPFMPFYVADYFADCSHLTTLQHGAYLLLIFTYWQRGKALPAYDEGLANIARLPIKEWLKMRPVIAAFFTEQDGEWIQDRCERELESFRTRSEHSRSAGKASAEAKAQRKFNGRSTTVDFPLNGRSTQRQPNVNSKSTRSQLEVNHVDVEVDLEVQVHKSKAESQNHCSSDDERPTDSPPISAEVISIQKSPAAALLEKQTQWFAVFWEAYWRKDGGKKAAWLKFCAKVRTEQQFHCVMNAVMAQTPVMLSREIEHRPHATTWLNQERWEDEHSPGKVGGDRESSSERLLRKVAENIRETGRPF